jgi:hypothetical protein
MTSATLSFNEEPHEYRLDGVRLPHVTGILEAMGLTPPFPPGPYRVRGKRVHDASVLFDMGVLGDYEVGDEVMGYIRSYERLYKDFPFKWTRMEHATYDRQLLVAGTIDRVGTIWGGKAVADLKTGEPGRAVELQTAAYACMECPEEPEEVWRFKIVLDKDGGAPTVRQLKNPQDIEAWRGLVNFHKWKQMKAA